MVKVEKEKNEEHTKKFPLGKTRNGHTHFSVFQLKLEFNPVFVSFSYIKMSSPNMNNMIMIGCLLSYLGVMLLGTDGGLVVPQHYPAMCSVSIGTISPCFRSNATKSGRPYGVRVVVGDPGGPLARPRGSACGRSASGG